MKKYFLFSVSIIIMISFIRCSSEDNNKSTGKNDVAVRHFDSTDLPTEKISESANDEFRLIYNFTKGESFSYRLTTLSNNKRKMEIDSVVSDLLNQETTRILKFNTISVENDSIAEMECIVTDININASMNDQTFSYTSGSTLDSADTKRFFEQEGLVNNPFSFRITKHGELLDIFKADGIIDRYIELSGLKDSIDIQQKTVYKNDIITNVLKPLVEQVFRDLPVQNMNVKSFWKKEIPAVPIMVFRIGYTNLYTVTGVEQLDNEKIAVINGVSTSHINGETKHSNAGINYEFEKPTSEASGKIYFNLDRGLVQKSKTKTRLSIKYTMEMISPHGSKNGSSTESFENNNILELL